VLLNAANCDLHCNSNACMRITHISSRQSGLVREPALVTSIWASCPSRRAILAPPPSPSIPQRGSPCWVARVCLIQRTSACSAAKASAVDLSSTACNTQQSNSKKHAHSRLGAKMECWAKKESFFWIALVCFMHCISACSTVRASCPLQPVAQVHVHQALLDTSEVFAWHSIA